MDGEDGNDVEDNQATDSEPSNKRKSDSKPGYCNDCSLQCKSGARRRNCMVCYSGPQNNGSPERSEKCLMKKTIGSPKKCPGFWDSVSCNFTEESNSQKCATFNNHLKQAVITTDSDSSENEADNCCVYTYKGLDLPLQNDKASDTPARSSSSEMDYLEMDFDPGTSNGHDCSDDSGHAVTSNQCYYQDSNDNVINYDPSSSNCQFNFDPCCSGHDCKVNAEQCAGGEHLNTDYNPSSSSLVSLCVKKDYPQLNDENHCDYKSAEGEVGDGNAYVYYSDENEDENPTQSLPSFSSVFIRPGDNYTTPDVSLQLDEISCEGELTCAELIENLLSYKDCILGENILRGNPSSQFLSYINIHLDSLNNLESASVGLHSWAHSYQNDDESEDGPKKDLRLQDFLLSYINLSPTFSDLLNECGCDMYYSRWFSTYPPRNFQLCKFLLHWIYRGAMPILSLNEPSNDSKEDLDNWQYKLVIGANKSNILFSKPYTFLSEKDVLKSLSLPPVARISRDKIMSFWSPSTDLTALSSHPSENWKRQNVLGQVVNVIRETLLWNDATTKHITIPSKYSPGITLVIECNSPYLSELKNFPELPFIIDNLPTVELS